MKKNIKKKKPVIVFNSTFYIFVAVGVVLLFLIISLLCTTRAMNNLSESKFVMTTARIFSLPAAEINGLKVNYADYIHELQILRKFYENPPAGVVKASSEQISDQAISRLLANRLVAELADEFVVEISAEDLAGFQKAYLAQYKNEEQALEVLEQMYGLNLEDYLEIVAKPIILEQKLRQAFGESQTEGLDKYNVAQYKMQQIIFVFDEENQEDVLAQAEEVLNRAREGEDLATLASEFDLEVVTSDWLIEDAKNSKLEQVALALSPGTVAEELVETDFAYHIVKLAQQRIVKDFFAFMDETMSTAEIEIKLPIHNPFN